MIKKYNKITEKSWFDKFKNIKCDKDSPLISDYGKMFYSTAHELLADIQRSNINTIKKRELQTPLVELMHIIKDMDCKGELEI